MNYNNNKILLADPDDEEEPMLESKFTVVCFLNRNDLSIYKQGGVGINIDMMNEAFKISKKRYNQINQIESLQVWYCSNKKVCAVQYETRYIKNHDLSIL